MSSNEDLTLSDVDQQAKPQVHQPRYYELRDFPSIGHIENKQKTGESRSQNVACIIRRVQSPLAEGQVRQGKFVCRFCMEKFIDKTHARAHLVNCQSRRKLQVLFKAKNASEGTTVAKNQREGTTVGKNQPQGTTVAKDKSEGTTVAKSKTGSKRLEDSERSQCGLRPPLICTSCSKNVPKKTNANQCEDTVVDDACTDHIGDEIPAMSTSERLPTKCRKCPLKFIKGEELSSHENGHEGRDPLLCLVCGKWFRFSRQLQTHTKDYHSFLQLFNV